ncbi:MAG TPA: GNAT family N-acetyltransferase [Candidatus Obscuribacterales bacterium]
MKGTIDEYKTCDELLDGQTVIVRAVHPADRSSLEEIWHHLSNDSIYYRFLSPKKELTDEELQYFTNLDFKKHVALLALLMRDGKEIPVGVGRYIVSEDDRTGYSAEVAFTVEDEYQGHGIGTILLKHLENIAREAGVTEFTALVFSENHKMLEVFEHSGLPMTKRFSDSGLWEIKLRLT